MTSHTTMTNKVCTKCKKTLPSSNFHKDKQKKDGLNSSCKLCVKKYSKIVWDKEKKKLVEKHEKEFQLLTTKGFRPVKGYDNYLIHKDGRAFSKRRRGGGGYCKMHVNKQGYLFFSIEYKNQKPIKMLLHRALALTFIDNPDNYEVVDHIDRNRQNNSLENLRWCSQSLNCRNVEVKGCITNRNETVKSNGKSYTYQGFRVQYTLPSGKKITKRFNKDKKKAEEYLKFLQKKYPRSGVSVCESDYICECGSRILKRSIRGHLKSKKHNNFLHSRQTTIKDAN